MTSLRLFCLVALLGVACNRRSDSVPIQMAGAWYTNAPRFVGRVFEVRPDWIRFYSGSGTVQVYRVKEVERKDRGASIRLKIRYQDPADKEITGTLSLRYSSETEQLYMRGDHRIAWQRIPDRELARDR
ncbi:MAG: hypothetical protein ACYTEG_13410 [Planctomycetota bacterium]|jgi:hypothetical protein